MDRLVELSRSAARFQFVVGESERYRQKRRTRYPVPSLPTALLIGNHTEDAADASQSPFVLAVSARLERLELPMDNRRVQLIT